MKKVAIILGAGSGERFGSYKQVEMINNKAVYSYSLDAFVDTNLFSTIFLVVPKKLINLIKNQLNEPKYKDVIICEGGDSRAQSVHNAYSKITTKNKKIFIHDAARPLINKKLIIDLAKFSKNKKATVLARKINETVRSVKKEKSEFTVDRSKLWIAETPQVFDSSVLDEAYRKRLSVIHEYTDEAAIVEDCGIGVNIYENSSINTKITTKEDLKIVKSMLTKDVFYGIGLDFHSLESGNGITVGGVKVPCNFGTVAHSDGDVLLHSIADSILGAAALGDIGIFFSDQDEKNKDLNSIEIIKYCLDQLNERELEIYNIDTTIICEQPKIAPYREKILKELSNLLLIPVSRIGLKATTSEKIGIIGENKAIAVQSLVNLIEKK